MRWMLIGKVSSPLTKGMRRCRPGPATELNWPKRVTTVRSYSPTVKNGDTT